MNDSELCTAVRESVAGIRSATPASQIIGRGRRIRARRRIPQATGATLAVAAGATLAVTALQPSGQPANQAAGHSGSARLAAWTVARQADGDIRITVSQLKDPAGLQATLRADGLPAIVSFAGPKLNAACRPYSLSLSQLRAVAQFHGSGGITVNPSALPRGTDLFIYDRPGTGPSGGDSSAPEFPGSQVPAPRGVTPLGHPRIAHPPRPETPTGGPLAIGLVYASPQCTG